MANETSALRGEPQQIPVAEDDYQSFSAALGASARGRAFLHEYARRNRHADTEVVLAALDRLETVARSQKSAPEAERIRQDLRALLDTIHSARPQIDSTPGAIKAATLAALIEFVQARLEALVQPMQAQLMAVPEPEQPELPIPQPGSAAQRTIALVHAIAPPPEPQPHPQPAMRHVQARNFDPEALLAEPPRSTKIIPEVNFIDSLFDAIDAKAQEKAEEKAQEKAKAAKISEAIVAPPAPPPTVVAAPFIAEAPPPPAAILPSVDMPGPVAETVAMAEPVARATTTAAAINASADAIDSIVAAAQAAMAEEAARAQAPSDNTTFVETFVAEAETPPPAPATSYLADAVSKTTAADPSQLAMSNALSAIMALSEEERLAMFT